MRGLADAERLRRFLKELAREAEADCAVYLTGGSTAVLLGWRESTIDADIRSFPEQDSLYLGPCRDSRRSCSSTWRSRAPSTPSRELPGWRERSLFIERLGKV